MKRTMMVAALAGLATTTQSFGALVLVEDFESYTLAAKPAGVAVAGLAGGFLDQESNTTSNVKIGGVADGNQYYQVQGHSSTSKRGAGFTGVADSIGDTESGAAFFRFRIAPSATLKVSTFVGMHDLSLQTGNLFLDGTTCVSESINAGFEIYRDGTSGTIDVRSLGATPTVLGTGLAQDTWYGAWIVANNATDTFDLYINALGNPGDAPAMPVVTDLIASNLAFSKTTTNALQGLMMIQPPGSTSPLGQSAEAHLDDAYWGTVPEPASMMLLAVGGALLTLRRR